MRADYEYKIYLILLVPIKTFLMGHNLVAARFDLPFWDHEWAGIRRALKTANLCQ